MILTNPASASDMRGETDNLPRDDRHTESAFETVIEAHLLANGYVTADGFDRDRAIFPIPC